LVVDGVLAQKVRLRSQITPTCTSSSGANAKFADIFGEGNIAVMGSYGCKGAFIFDITNPDAPVLANWYNPGNNQQFLEAIVVGNRGYFASGNSGGVHIVDLSNPYSPQLLGIVNSTNGGGHNSIHEMVVMNQGGGIFLIENFNSTSNKTLKVINVTNPAAPVFVRDIIPTEPQWVHAMVVKGNRMFTSGWGNGTNRGRTEIYDISNITTQAPTLLGFVSDPSSVVTAGNRMHSAWPSEDGNYLYSCRELLDGDVRVYDIHDPAVPVLVNTIKASSYGLNAVAPHNPVVHGNYLYVAWYQAGIQVFELSNPAVPKRVGQYDTYQTEFVYAEPDAKKSRSSKLSLAETEPWDIFCGAENLQNALPSTYDGNWAVYPFLGQNKVLAGDLKNGLLVLDVTGVTTSPKNVVSDFDGDKRTDLAVFHPSNGGWQIERSSDGLAMPVKMRGAPTGDLIVPGDYDGDGVSEIGTYRPSTAQWMVRNIRPFGPARFVINGIYGSPGDIPVAADYDADGKTDVAQWRPSTGAWQIWQSTLGQRTVAWFVTGVPQQSTDKPLVGDYDGDGKIDLAVWRPATGTFYVQQSSSSILLTVVLGQNGDKPVSADFDGNGVTDMAVYRPSNGTWYFRDPSTGLSSSFAWGLPEDTPIPADYDGDATSDFAVFRPSTNQWLRINSSNGSTIDRVFGQSGDVPSPASIQPQ
ncbi:MAG: FG-GAP-like repeat-containing protein, partial [Pyrinomonadaceae bacterium]